MTTFLRRTVATLFALALMGTGIATADRHAMKADLVGTAAAAGSFKTLVTAVEAAGLAETLKGPGPFTVFAPTDEAFAKLPAGTVEDLLKPENRDRLAAILAYHVVPGQVMSSDVAGKATRVATVQGAPINVDATAGTVKVNGASVISADVTASNGVIHVIDTVILPPNT